MDCAVVLFEEFTDNGVRWQNLSHNSLHGFSHLNSPLSVSFLMQVRKSISSKHWSSLSTATKATEKFLRLVLWCNKAGSALAVRICDWWNKCLMATALCVYWRLHWSVNFVLVIIDGARVLWMGDLTARSVVHAIRGRSSDKSTHFAVVPSVWHHHYACTDFIGRGELGTGLTTWWHYGSFPFSDSVENIIDFMKLFSNSCLSLGFFYISWMASNMLW